MEAAWDQGQWVLLSGPAGVGKTCLLREFALPRGRPQTYGDRPADASLPCATLSRALREQLAAQPGPELVPWVRYELARLAPELQDTPPAPLRAQDKRLRLCEAFAAFMESKVQGEVVLLCDDLQFFDLQSLEMLLFALAYLRTQGLGQRLAMAYRKGKLRPEAHRLLQRFTRAHPGLEQAPQRPPQVLALRLLGSSLFRLGQPQEATERLEQGLAADQQYASEQIATLCVDLAYSLLQQGQAAPARRRVEQALRLTQPWQHDHALALNALARHLANLTHPTPRGRLR